MYEIIRYLASQPERIVVLKNDETKREIRGFIEGLMAQYPNWDRLNLDFAYTLVLDYLNFISTAEGSFPTYQEMAEYVRENATQDDGHFLKLYEKHSRERIEQDTKLQIVLTTMHKVKGLEFDAVIITPSYATLPFEMINCATTEANRLTAIRESIEEEKRLLYVAYTRAKKYLKVYKWRREEAIMLGKSIRGLGRNLGFSDSSDLNRFYLDFAAQEKHFPICRYIRSNVAKNQPIRILGGHNTPRNYYIRGEKNQLLGRLATNSWLASAIRKNDALEVAGFFVNQVVVWTYQDALESDRRNKSNFANRWSKEAKAQGYIYLVDFAGFGTIVQKADNKG